MSAATMSDAAVVTIGLPESGKTTFLAALWHLVFSDDMETKLRLEELRSGELAHLNAIAERWRTARVQDRTSITRPRLVDMRLRGENGETMRLVFPDIAGEAYRQIWEERECDQSIGDMLTGDAGILLFIHADMIRFPGWISDNIGALEHAAAADGTEMHPWDASLAPTQVKLVDLLSIIGEGANFEGPPRRIALVFSAWDKAEFEELAPHEFLAKKLPLLDQYLRQNRATWDVRVYGVSAQGCDYDTTEVKDRNADALAVLAMDTPSARIRVIHGQADPSHDLTEPIAWLVG